MGMISPRESNVPDEVKSVWVTANWTAESVSIKAFLAGMPLSGRSMSNSMWTSRSIPLDDSSWMIRHCLKLSTILPFIRRRQKMW